MVWLYGFVCIGIWRVGEVWVGLKHKSLLLDWPKSSYQSRMYGFHYVVWNVHVALGYMDFTTEGDLEIKVQEILNFELCLWWLENSIQLQQMVLEGRIGWATNSHWNRTQRETLIPVAYWMYVCMYVCMCACMLLFYVPHLPHSQAPILFFHWYKHAKGRKELQSLKMRVVMHQVPS